MMAIHKELSSELLAVVDMLEYEFDRTILAKGAGANTEVEVFIDADFLRGASKIRYETLCQVMQILESRIDGMRIVKMYDWVNEETPWPEEQYQTRFQTFAQIILPGNFKKEAARFKSELQLLEPGEKGQNTINTPPPQRSPTIPRHKIVLDYQHKRIRLISKDNRSKDYHGNVNVNSHIFRIIECLSQDEHISPARLAAITGQAPGAVNRSIKAFNSNTISYFKTDVPPLSGGQGEDYSINKNLFDLDVTQVDAS